MEIGRYRKLIAAVLGITLMITLRYFNIELAGLEPIVVETLIGALTSFGVYQATND